MKPSRILLALAATTTALATGCGDPCEELLAVCANCPDASYRTFCEAIAAKQNHAVCSADVAVFRPQCPAPPTSSSSTASASSTGLGTGGAGGN